MVVLTDTGEALDIHPIDKQTPGERLALLALKNVYDYKNLIALGPTVKKATKQGNTVVVEFVNCNAGLQTKELPKYYDLQRNSNKKKLLVRNSPNTQVEGFAILGNDNKWFWADRAEIVDNKIQVSSQKVSNPIKIRYGWMANPTVNLYNKAGLPAVPFEMDVN